jgi:acetyl-CoA carboxylase biotin carboxyl carrier protein
VGNEELGYEEILEIMRLFESSSEFSELRLKYGSTELNLRKQGAGGSSFATSASAAATTTPAPIAAAAPGPKAAAHPAAEAAVLPEPQAAPAKSSKPLEVKSPTVGTFYQAPEPGAPPFVSVGQRVQPDTTVCIIEVMKVMNSIQADCTGTVSQILVKDSEPVEFGQVLMVIEQD